MLLPDKVTQMFIFITAASIIRYFVIAGIAYLVWYILLKNKVSSKKIQLKFPKTTDYQREVFHSMLTFLIFGIIGVALYNTKVRPYTLTYYKIADYGWSYFILSFFLTLIIHDTYFIGCTDSCTTPSFTNIFIKFIINQQIQVRGLLFPSSHSKVL